jgi:hypothetical protein
MTDATTPSKSSITITWNPNREQYEVRFTAPEDSFKQIIKDFKKVDFEHRSYNGGNRVWSFSPQVLDEITRIAVRWFHNAQLVEGEKTVNLHTGRAVSQLTLFAI